MKNKKMSAFVCIICTLVLMISVIFADRYDSFAAISKSPRLNVKNLSITKNKTYTLRLYNIKKSHKISFRSSNSDVVQIKRVYTKSCIIRAKASGSASVTASIKDDALKKTYRLKCKVTVSPPAISVKFNNKKCKITEGETKKQKITIKPNISCEKPVFTSEDEHVATISSTGIINGVAPGKTVIHAVLSNGKEALLKVTVTASKEKPTEAPPTKTIAPGPTPPAATATPVPTVNPPAPTPGAEHEESVPKNSKGIRGR